jgi:hypothetical protein
MSVWLDKAGRRPDGGVSILASFCVWTKSLKCKDAVNRDSTIQSLQVEEFKFPVSLRPDDVSSRPDARQTSIIRPDEVFISSGPHTVSRSFCASLHPSGSFSITSGRLPVLDQFLISFQVPRKGRSINRLDACLRKARIVVQN